MYFNFQKPLLKLTLLAIALVAFSLSFYFYRVEVKSIETHQVITSNPIVTNRMNMPVLSENDVSDGSKNEENIVNYTFEDEEIQTWLTDKGYNILREYIAFDEPEVSMSASPYQAYDTETMQALAEQGDPIAQYYYGLSIEIDNPIGARDWFREAIINGGYTSTVLSIYDTYFNEIDLNEESLQMQAIDEEQLHKWKEKRISLTNQAYIWMIWGSQRNDSALKRVLNESDFSLMSESRQHQLVAEANQQHKTLNAERKRRGLPVFDESSMTDSSEVDVEMFETFFNSL